MVSERMVFYKGDVDLQTGRHSKDLDEDRKRLAASRDELGREERGLLEQSERAFAKRISHYCDLEKAVGQRYAKARLSNFECPTDAHEKALAIARSYLDELLQPKPRNLIFLGPPGCGKDHLQFAILRAAALYFGHSVGWFDGQAFFAAIRDAIKRDDSEDELVRLASSGSILAMSDPLPANGCVTDHQRNILFRILDNRYREFLPTIATLNVATRDELNNRLGDSLADRLCDDAVVVACNWPSYRKTASASRTGG